MMLRLITGEEKFPVGQSKFHVFFVPTNQFPGAEKHVGILTRENHSHVRLVGYPERMPAAPGMAAEHVGKWTRSNLDIDSGVVLKVFGMRRMSGSQQQMASQYIQLREGAALRRITMATCRWPKGQFNDVEIEGKFDLLTITEATHLGAKTVPTYARFHNPAMVRVLFRESQLAPETVSREIRHVEQVVNSDGAVVPVVSHRRQRKLEV